jgi:hypothetical protein
MAPEQAAGRTKFVGPAADVYALGVILYECLTGRTPFVGENALDLVRRVATEQPPPPRGLNAAIDPNLESVCLKCLEKEPHDRYPSAGALADDLARHLRGEAVSARPPGFGDWLWQLWRTRPELHSYATPPLLLWFGGIYLTGHSAIFGLVVAGASVAGVWALLALIAGTMGAVTWWYLLRRFRQLLGIERQSAVVALGHICAQVALMGLLPLPPHSPASAGMHYYAALTAVTGMALLAIGSTHWGRCILFGVILMSFAPVMHWFPLAAPLLYGAAGGAVAWYWAFALAVTFRERTGRVDGSE